MTMGDSQVVQPARDRLIADIAKAMQRRNQVQFPITIVQALEVSWEELADAALRVIESKSDPASETIIPCTCGQNGYAPNSPHSNHPHFPGCLHYDEVLFSAYKAAFPKARIPHNHVTRDIKPVGQCPGCDLYHAGNPRETK